jgi:putative ABC transport system permease protein
MLESFSFAWGALRGNILRTALSLLGVTVGIFSLILIFTAVDSLENGVRKSLSFVGDKVIYVEKWPWSFSPNYPWWKYINRPQPTYSEFEFLQENIENAKAVSIMADRRLTAKQGSNSIRANFMGISFNHKDVADIPVEDGRYFTELETNTGQNVAIIGSSIKEALFPTSNPLGQEINLNGRKFKVIGVMRQVGEQLLDAPSNDENIFVPFRAFTKVYFVGKYDGVGASIAVKGTGDADPDLKDLEGEVEGLMRQRRGLRPGQEQDFALNKPQMLADFISNIFGVITIAGGIISLFSILIGGFGIANIMFVSVRERTGQIGIQKSLGAKRSFILWQFLFEAIFLSLIGGIIGMMLVYPLTFISIGSLDFVLSTKNIVIGLSLSSVIGIISGLIPAWSAAKMDPVTAIRMS